MGKRELLLIAGFIAMGALVYSFTAPPAADSSSGFSVGRLLDSLRREIHGDRASVERTTTTLVPVAASIRELRFDAGRAILTVTGEDRTDVACELLIKSTGFDDAEARTGADKTALLTKEGGGSLNLSVYYPEEGQQRATITLKVPRRLQLRVQSRSTLAVRDVAQLDIVDGQGKVTVSGVGRVFANHRGGAFTIERADEVKISSRGSDVRLTSIRGPVRATPTAGELRGSDLQGAIEIDANDAQVTLDDLSRSTGPIRINASSGRVIVKGLAAETRIEGRGARIEATIHSPAPIVISNDGDDEIDVTLPAGGAQLDAQANGGRLRLPPGLPAVVAEDDAETFTGPIAGGGPSIALRSSGGDIVVRAHQAAATTPPAPVERDKAASRRPHHLPPTLTPLRPSR